MDTKWPLQTDLDPAPIKSNDYHILVAQFVVVTVLVILIRPSFVISHTSELDVPSINLTAVVTIAGLSVVATVATRKLKPI